MATKHGRVGKLLRSASLDSGVIGLQGEKKTTEALALMPTGYTLFSSLRMPGWTNGDIDHVLVRTGCPIVLLIDSKMWTNAHYITLSDGQTQRRIVGRNISEVQDFPAGNIDPSNVVAHMSRYLDDDRLIVRSMLAIWHTIPDTTAREMDLSLYKPKKVDYVVPGDKLRKSVATIMRVKGSLPNSTRSRLKALT